MTTASAQMSSTAQARVYAYDLQQVEGDVTTVTFKTNTKANTAVVTLSAEGQDDIMFNATSTDGKNWTAEITPSGEFAADVEYNWSVEVSADAVTAWKQINQDGATFSFYRSYGVIVDNNPESDNFGRAYVSNNYAGTARSKSYPRATTVGFYTFNPELVAENTTAYACSVVGAGESSVKYGSPRDLSIDEEGNLYLADCSKTKSGIYIVNPNNNYSSTAVFTGTRDADGIIKNANDEIVSGPTCGVGVRGTGEEREIYSLAYHGPVGEATYIQYVNRFEIGDKTEWNVKPTWSNYNFKNKTVNTENGGTTVQVVNQYFSIEPISTGGYWVAQNRTTSSKANPSVFYCNSKNEVLYSAEENGGMAGTGSKNGALAVNERLGLVAFSLAAKAGVISYTMNDDETIEASIVSTNSLSPLAQADAMAFDYAGNLYAVTANTEAMAVYAIPTANNKCSTPAKKDLTISYTQGEIEATGIETIESENAPVEYYNLQGVKVENPENGIFIKKQGRKTTKVIL